MRKYKEEPSLRKRLGSGIKAAIAFELVLFVSCYVGWKKLNNSQDLRYKVYKKCPSILELYYKVGDMYKSDMRQLDSEAWQQIHEHK